MHYKKHTFSGVFLILILVLLSGCSKSGKSENEIINDLQANPVFISKDVEISNYEIIKRQTNVDNKTDLVYITVHTNDPELTCSLSYELKYELYNEGWLLESMMRYYDGPWDFSGLQDKQLLSDIKDSDYYFSDWDLELEDIEITDEKCDSNAIAYYEKQIDVDLIAHNMMFDYYSSYTVFYEIVNGTWQLQNVEVQRRKYVPTYSPGISATDAIMETLEMDISHDEKNIYDSFEYLRAEKDWENCHETRYYSATKSWFYGTETFLIEIPLNFYLEENEPYWHYNSDEIIHTLQKVDWDIIGSTWACDYSNADGWSGALNSYAVVNLRILDVMETDDPNTYNAKLYCNGYSIGYRYKCFAEEGTTAKLSYTGKYWNLSIEEPTNLADDVIWIGAFSFYGFEYLGRQGVFWFCTRDGVKLQQM